MSIATRQQHLEGGDPAPRRRLLHGRNAHGAMLSAARTGWADCAHPVPAVSNSPRTCDAVDTTSISSVRAGAMFEVRGSSEVSSPSERPPDVNVERPDQDLPSTGLDNCSISAPLHHVHHPAADCSKIETYRGAGLAVRKPPARSARSVLPSVSTTPGRDR